MFTYLIRFRTIFLIHLIILCQTKTIIFLIFYFNCARNHQINKRKDSYYLGDQTNDYRYIVYNTRIYKWLMVILKLFY